MLIKALISTSCRKLQESELENVVLKDLNSHMNRLHRLGYSNHTTLATSGRFTPSTSLLTCIKLLSEKDFSSDPVHLGSGRFGVCYLRTLSHYDVCVKVFKKQDSSALCHEANILSRFLHPNLPYLFGVCIGDKPSVVTSFHGITNQSITVHRALYSSLSDTLKVIDWKSVIMQVLSGLDHLHSSLKILHNDLKDDNIVLTLRRKLNAVIVDFGKACEMGDGKRYSLTREKERYKVHHPQIAPDLRDGQCKQSKATDVYSIGRVMKIINDNSTLNNVISRLSEQCMQYDGSLRPDVHTLTYSFPIYVVINFIVL